MNLHTIPQEETLIFAPLLCSLASLARFATFAYTGVYKSGLANLKALIEKK